MHSLILTVHNKEFILSQVLESIKKYTTNNYELIVVLDGCTDSSEDILDNFINQNKNLKVKKIYTPDVFETKANNSGLKEATGDKVIIIQDDMIINEDAWNLRLQKPFDEFNDVFAVTASSAFNYRFNSSSQHIHLSPEIDREIGDCWSDIFIYESHINRSQGLNRNIFAVRNNVCRGPLMIDHSDLIKLNYFDEIFEPQDQDDADLCYRSFKKLGKVVGAYWIDYISEISWGGTRPDGNNPAPWLLRAHHKNTRIVFERHRDIILNENHDQNRVLK
jgi:glycosyltransferase involved in cell wall biosynthesis